jgi:hypothetical protein
LVLILRHVVQGAPTARLAREVNYSRRLLDVGHHLQPLPERLAPPAALPDLAAKADEMYQNAGEKIVRTATRSGAG